MEDVRWLGFDWEDRLFYASDYFEQLYEWAVQLIKAGKAYVCDLTAEEIREYRGTPTEPGKESPYRNRSVEENLDLFERMKNGEFPDGSRTLRAKIDMASPNFNMRDPVMYRILHAEHHRTGNKWCIYPMYDYAHGAVGFDREDHALDLHARVRGPSPALRLVHRATSASHHPQQIEFDRLNLTYTMLSKRKLLTLVQEGLRHRLGRSAHADALRHAPPRLHARRRSATSARTIGVSKTNGIIELSLLEHCLREDLNKRAARVHGRAAAAARSSSTTIPTIRSKRWTPSTIPKTPPRARARCRSRKSSTSSRTISAKIRRSSTTAFRRAAKCVCATPTSSRARTS